MKIIKVEWKNFGSYGNRKQVLEFPEESKLYQVVGNNGVGKTTISQVISFCLFGKVEGKKLGDIPNRINGHAWTKIEFESRGRIVTVERGLEPSIFNLYLDGVIYDQAGSKNVQDYLVDELIGLPFYVFNNTISLSINDFKSFIKMSPQDKRAIVDKIFGFHILNQMRETLKSEMKRIKEDADSLKGSLSSLERSIEQSNNEMSRLLSEIETQSKDEIEKLKDSLLKFKELQNVHKGKIEEFIIIENNMSSLVSEASRSLIQTRSEIQELERRLKLYQSDKCPICESDLSGDFHNSIKEELESDKQNKSIDLKNFDDNLRDLRSEENELRLKKSDLSEKGNKISGKIREINSQIDKINSSNPDAQITSLKRINGGLNLDKFNVESKMHSSYERSIWIQKLDSVLGEKGVKQMAIKTILPSLNSEITDLLREMNLEFQITFDDEFKASIFHMGAEIPVQSLSTGEMKKVDFVVLIAIMKLMKLKFSTINLLFLDELFSSVDPEGVHSILKILKKNSKDMGLNIFVINHAQMPHEIFDLKLDVTKTNNFSSIQVDTF
jgi:DNA repair exonuclease SbcCD ATPase subunit